MQSQPLERLPLAGVLPPGCSEDITLTGGGAVKCGGCRPSPGGQGVAAVINSSSSGSTIIHSPRRPSHPLGLWAFGSRPNPVFSAASAPAGYVFCMLHRLPEQHDCTFDHMGRGREEAIMKMVKLDRKVGRSCQRIGEGCS